MNARVLLLVLVTGLFMAAWNGDQTAMEAAIVRRDVRIANARLALLQKQNDEVKTAAVVISDGQSQSKHSLTVARVSDHKEEVVLTAQPVEDVVPLPRGIAPGEYQAVNQDTGVTQKVTVAETVANDTARDFYTVDDDQGARWYLIRIAENAATKL